jgi:hypothetical protein
MGLAQLFSWAIFVLCREENDMKLDYYYDPREFMGPWYWERGFLSCVIAGAEIPKEITPGHFKMPFNRKIFEALQAIPPSDPPRSRYGLVVALLSRDTPLDPYFEDYLENVEGMIGVPGAAHAFAAKLIELKAGVLA